MVAPPGESRSGSFLAPENSHNRATDPEFENPADSKIAMKAIHHALLILVTALTSGCTVCVQRPRGVCVQGYPIRHAIVYRMPSPAPCFVQPPWCQPPPFGPGEWVRPVAYRSIPCLSPVYPPPFESGPSSRFISNVPAVERFESTSLPVSSEAVGRRGNAVVPLLPDP